MSVLLRVRCPPTAFPAAIRLERRHRHVPSRKAALKEITGSHTHPKDPPIGQDVAQTILSKPMVPMSEMGSEPGTSVLSGNAAISASVMVVPSPPVEKSAIGAGDAAPRLCLLLSGGAARAGSSLVPKRSTGAIRAWPLGGQRRTHTRQFRRTSARGCVRVPREWPDATLVVCGRNPFGV